MKILSVTHFYESHGGGIERVAAHLCREFVRDGHSVAWAASDEDDPPGDPIKAVPLRCWNPTERTTGLPMPIPGPNSIRKLARAIRASDAVVVHDALYLTSILALVIARLSRKPVVLVQHIASIAFASLLMQKLMRLANYLVTSPMLYAADQLVFVSNEIRRQLLGEPAGRDSMVLFNGVDTSIFRPIDGFDRATVRSRHGLPVDSTIVLFVGRFVEWKGLKILERLAAHRLDLNFALVGDGAVRPDSWQLPNVHVLGRQSQQTLAELYSACDLLLLPAPSDSFSLVVREAMACGVPVVCGESCLLADPGAAQWLRGIEIDLTDPAVSTSRCGAAVDTILKNPPDRLEMARYAANTYSWPTMADAIVQSLSSVHEVHAIAQRA
jgi:glycosyltransferase involved in cell wall biosynthesis